MRISIVILFCASLQALAGGVCDSPATAGHYTLAGGRVQFCAALRSVPQAVATAGLPAGGTLTGLVELTTGAAEGRTLLVSHAKEGLFRSEDGGRHWARASGAGSGLEATSQQADVLLGVKTAWGGLDALAGMTGATNGGVYLSGDGGIHWMQLQSGFNPANMALTALVKSSCAGCPVQYYSASMGGGMYTRTIAVSPPPEISGWNFGADAGACGTAAPGGPAGGGQAFALCGKNFQSGALVQFGATELRSCKLTTTRITCMTPAGTGSVKIRVRNPDTRSGALAQDYAYAAPKAAATVKQ